MYDLDNIHPMYQGVWGYYACAAHLSISYRYVVRLVIMPQYNDNASDAERYYYFLFDYFLQLYNFHHVMHGKVFYQRYVAHPVKREILLRELVYSLIIYSYCEILISLGCATLGYRHIPIVPACFSPLRGDVTDVLVLPSYEFVYHCTNLIILIYKPQIYKKITQFGVLIIVIYQLVFSSLYTSVIGTGRTKEYATNCLASCYYFQLSVLFSYYSGDFAYFLKKYFILCDVLAPFLFNTVLTFLTNYTGQMSYADQTYFDLFLYTALEYLTGLLFCVFLLLLESGRCYYHIYLDKFLCKYVGDCQFFMAYASVLVCALYTNIFENIQFGPFHYEIVVQIMFALTFFAIIVANFMQRTAKQVIYIGKLI